MEPRTTLAAFPSATNNVVGVAMTDSLRASVMMIFPCLPDS